MFQRLIIAMVFDQSPSIQGIYRKQEVTTPVVVAVTKWASLTLIAILLHNTGFGNPKTYLFIIRNSATLVTEAILEVILLSAFVEFSETKKKKVLLPIFIRGMGGSEFESTIQLFKAQNHATMHTLIGMYLSVSHND